MKVSIQAVYRIALPLYTREVYHTFRSKTTGKQPELSIKVILSITFFLINTFCRHLYTLHRSIFIVIQTLYTDRTAKTSSCRINATIMIDKIPITLKLYNSLMIRIAISSQFI